MELATKGIMKGNEKKEKKKKFDCKRRQSHNKLRPVLVINLSAAAAEAKEGNSKKEEAALQIRYGKH